MFLDSFKIVFHIIFTGESGFWEIVWTSVGLSLASTFLASIVGVIIAVFIVFNESRFTMILIQLFKTSLAIPTVVIGLFLYGLLTRSGALGGYGLLYSSKAIILGQVFLILPIVVSFVHSALKGLDGQIRKTAKSLGASSFYSMYTVVREAKMGIVVAIFAAFGRAISEVGISMILGGNIDGFTRTMTTAIALEHNKGNFALGLALGLLLLMITFVINILFQNLNKVVK
jgi:tungstate transport system permease protein